MIYKDLKNVRIESVINRAEEFVAKRQIIAFGDDITDIQQWLEATPARWTVCQSKDAGATGHWDLGVGYSGALKLAKDGWAEGAAKVNHSLQAIIPAAGRAPRWGYAESGTSVSIGRFLTGHPKNMRSRRKRTQGSAPVLHIVVNTVASCAVNAEQMANFGAAMVGLIDRLEGAGRRVHLDAAMVVISNDIRLSMGWNVKRAQDAVDISQVAFAIAHPAALRRIGFAMMERVSDDAESYGYGRCADATPYDVPDYTDGTMIIDGVNHQPKRCNSVEDALRLAIEQINKAAVLAGHADVENPLINEADALEFEHA